MTTIPRPFSLRPIAGLVLVLALSCGMAEARAQSPESAMPSLTLGGLALDTDGPLSLSQDAPSLSLGLSPTQNSLPLYSHAQPPGAPPGPEAGMALGTRLSIGQPLDVDFLGGNLDWKAAATVEQAPQGEAYGLSLSLGSMAESPTSAPSDLRVGLTYGREPEVDEHGVMLDFSYSF